MPKYLGRALKPRDGKEIPLTFCFCNDTLSSGIHVLAKADLKYKTIMIFAEMVKITLESKIARCHGTQPRNVSQTMVKKSAQLLVLVKLYFSPNLALLNEVLSFLLT